jgi:integrase
VFFVKQKVKQKYTTMVKQGFTSPKLFDYSGDLSKEWYVGFRYTDPSTGIRKPIQIRLGINFHRELSTRKKEGNAVKKLIEDALNQGWNPQRERIEDHIVRTTSPSHLITQKPFNEALQFAYDSKEPNLSGKSKDDIKGVLKFAKEAAVKISFANMPISDVESTHVKLLLTQIGKDRQDAYNENRERKLQKLLAKGLDLEKANRLTGPPKKWSGNSYNKYREYLQILFSELEELRALKYNPCLKISSKPEIRTNIHRHPTEIEYSLIKKTLSEKHPMFGVYYATLVLTGIRPGELFGIQIKDFDRLNQCFDVHETEGGSKTRSFRKVPIPNTLLKHLGKLNLDNYAPEDYIFTDNFLPGKNRKNRADYATKIWKKLIKDGLGIKVSMYSGKGKGGEMKRNAGIELGVVSGGFGHSSYGMSRIYLHGEQDRMNQQIIDKTPDF